MTDAEILAHQRAKHGNPYMPLSVAKEMQRLERKWQHLGAEVERKRREGKIPEPEPCRYSDGTCLTHGGRHRDR
jgi:hypothetical protein